MIWHVAFSERCDKDILRMHPADANDICGAVDRFAHTGRGFVTHDAERNIVRIEAAIDDTAFARDRFGELAGGVPYLVELASPDRKHFDVLFSAAA